MSDIPGRSNTVTPELLHDTTRLIIIIINNSINYYISFYASKGSLVKLFNRGPKPLDPSLFVRYY